MEISVTTKEFVCLVIYKWSSISVELALVFKLSIDILKPGIPLPPPTLNFLSLKSCF